MITNLRQKSRRLVRLVPGRPGCDYLGRLTAAPPGSYYQPMLQAVAGQRSAAREPRGERV